MSEQLRDYLTLCKPKVVLLMLITAWAGMYLATSQGMNWFNFFWGTIGIALLAGAAATINHIIDHRIDALMTRTEKRPLATGRLTLRAAQFFSITQALLGFFILYFYVNPLTAWLTFASAIGYAIIYSVYLKHATPQNIVIGGITGAMPPLLGWTAITGQLDPQGWLLVLIIFAWTPAHFWALCLYRLPEYQKASIPMLPVTHGIQFTKLNIIFYTLLTAASSLLPYAIDMSGTLYLISAVFLNVGFIYYAVRLYFIEQYETLAMQTFQYSLIYLCGLFVMILIDHHLRLI